MTLEIHHCTRVSSSQGSSETGLPSCAFITRALLLYAEYLCCSHGTMFKDWCWTITSRDRREAETYCIYGLFFTAHGIMFKDWCWTMIGRDRREAETYCRYGLFFTAHGIMFKDWCWTMTRRADMGYSVVMKRKLTTDMGYSLQHLGSCSKTDAERWPEETFYIWMFKPEFSHFLFSPYMKGFWSWKYTPLPPGN